MFIKFWGVRGSVPVPGKDTIFFGGNTTCMEIRPSDNKLLIIDAGTGIRLLGLELLKSDFGKGRGEAHILFSHTHWDHIQGFPFFMPAYVGHRNDSNRKPDKSCNKLHLYGVSDVDERLEVTLRGQMEHFYFPVDMENLGALIKFHPIQDKTIKIGSVFVTAKRLIHPNGVLGFRIQDGNKTLVVATDCEHPSDGTIDSNLLELAKEADVLVYDSQYSPEEYNPSAFGASGPTKIGWGHSTPLEGAKVAIEAGVKKLVLTHHDPLHNDDDVRRIEKIAQENFPNSIAAYEGLVIQV
ncbi:MBL fold metallo-hydrolase [bacterium]|nr:MBL fold metallo-hydrolase [bacterium]